MSLLLAFLPVFAIAASAASPPAPAPAPPVEDVCQPSVAAPLHPCMDLDKRHLQFLPLEFDFDKAYLRPAALTIVAEIAALILRHPELGRLEIRNHRAYDPSYSAYGRELTRDRARTVMAALIKHGVPAARLTAQGFGASQPIVLPGRSPKNRRTEILILGP